MRLCEKSATDTTTGVNQFARLASQCTSSALMVGIAMMRRETKAAVTSAVQASKRASDRRLLTCCGDLGGLTFGVSSGLSAASALEVVRAACGLRVLLRLVRRGRRRC